MHGRFAGLKVLELGAGAALPSLVLLAQQDALPSAVIISDFDDPAIVEAMRKNVEANAHLLRVDICRVVGHTWGTSIAPLIGALADIAGCTDSPGACFDVILLADTLWDQQPHDDLLSSICALLAPMGEVGAKPTRRAVIEL